MTTPSLAELAREFPEITNDYFNTSTLRDQTLASYGSAIAILGMKFVNDKRCVNDERYDKFKSRLKLASKISRIGKFSLTVAIIKAIDNLKSMDDYSTDIEAGRIILHQDIKLGPAYRLDKNSPLILSSAEARRNIRDRETYHERVMAHIEGLAAKAEKSRKGSHNRKSHDAIREILDAYFYAAKGRFMRHIEKAPYVLPPLQLKAA